MFRDCTETSPGTSFNVVVTFFIIGLNTQDDHCQFHYLSPCPPQTLPQHFVSRNGGGLCSHDMIWPIFTLQQCHNWTAAGVEFQRLKISVISLGKSSPMQE